MLPTLTIYVVKFFNLATRQGGIHFAHITSDSLKLKAMRDLKKKQLKTKENAVNHGMNNDVDLGK